MGKLVPGKRLLVEGNGILIKLNLEERRNENIASSWRHCGQEWISQLTLDGVEGKGSLADKHLLLVAERRILARIQDGLGLVQNASKGATVLILGYLCDIGLSYVLVL
jgi:hypothetical protein